MRNLEIRTRRSWILVPEENSLEKPKNDICWTICDQSLFLYYVINQRVYKYELDTAKDSREPELLAE